MVEAINSDAISNFKKQMTIKGNNTITCGKYGERKNKKDGLDHKEKLHQMQVDGAMKSRAAIKFVMKRNKNMQAKLTTDKGKAKWKQLRADITERLNQFELKRVLVKTEAWEKTIDKNKNPNVLQRRVGIVEKMPLLEGEVTYSLLREARDREQIKTELRFRGLPDDGGWKNSLLMRLKLAEKERGSLDKYNFLPLSPEVDFRFLMEGSGDKSDEEEMW
jgi:hypothetical protein